MRSVTAQRKRGGGHGFGRSYPVAFDAGDLHKSSHRIASHAEMMLKRDLGGVFDLLRRAAEHGAEACRRHGCRRPNFALTAGFGTGNRGVVLDQPADGRGSEQEVGNLGGFGAGAVVEVIAQYCWDDARCPIGRRRHNLSSGGVLLVHGHSVYA